MRMAFSERRRSSLRAWWPMARLLACGGAGMLLWAWPALAQPGQTGDSFEGAELGTNWKVIEGDWQVADGKLVLKGDTAGNIQWGKPLPAPPFVVEASLRQPWVYAMPWREPMAGLKLTGDTAPARGLSIYRRSAGNIERPPEAGEQDRKVLGAARGEEVRLSLEVTESAVVVYANGAYVAATRPTEDAPLRASLFASAQCVFDDFLIRPGSYRRELAWDFKPMAGRLSAESYDMLQRLATLAEEIRSRSVFCSRHPGLEFVGPTDPQETFCEDLREMQETITRAVDAGEAALAARAQQLEARLQRCRLVTWPFNRYLLVSKKALPPGLADLEKLELVCARNEIEPAAFYVSNLADAPCTLEVRITGPADAASLRYVDSRGEYIDIIRPLGYVPETDEVGLDPTLTIPAAESRQIWIDLDTHALNPGKHAFTVRLVPRRDGWPEKSVLLEVSVLPVTLPEKAPFDTFAFNYARHSPECIADLLRHKVNWFSLSEPPWELVDGRVVINFDSVDREVPVSLGKGPHLSIYGWVQSMAKTLREKHGISWEDPRTKLAIADYLRQWTVHLEGLGLGREDYVLQVWDEPRTPEEFEKLREIMPLLRQLAPDVRFATDPLTQDADFLHDMSPHIYLWIPHHGTVFVNDPDPETVAQRMPDNNNAMTLGVYKAHQRAGARLWTYHQYGGRNGHGMCPVLIYRHYVWKIVWRMKADGVSFFAHWYASGHLKYPSKGWEAWREGVEDVQWAMLLRDAVESGKLNTPRAREALQQVDHLGAALDWWVEQPLHRCEDMDRARQIAMRVLAGLPATE